MGQPKSSEATAWTFFAIWTCACFILSWLYLRSHRNKKDTGQEAVSMFWLCVMLLALSQTTIGLIPLDIFFATSMKRSDGSFQDWAQLSSTREEISETVLTTYYVIYSLFGVVLYILIPCVMELILNQGEGFRSFYSIICGLFLIVTGLVGYFLGVEAVHSVIRFFSAISLVIGLAFLVIFTSHGMWSLPWDMVWNNGQRLWTSNPPCLAPSGDGQLTAGQGWTHRLGGCMARTAGQYNINLSRVMSLLKVAVGVVFLALSSLVLISLIIVTSDQVMNHNVGSYAALLHKNLTNPLDQVFLFLHGRSTYLDYVLLLVMATYLTAASHSGCLHLLGHSLGLTRGWVNKWNLTLATIILSCLVQAGASLLCELLPGYVSFGGQRYETFPFYTDTQPEDCTLQVDSNDCVLSRKAYLHIKFSEGFCGNILYGVKWAFLVAMVIGLVVVPTRELSISKGVVKKLRLGIHKPVKMAMHGLCGHGELEIVQCDEEDTSR